MLKRIEFTEVYRIFLRIFIGARNQWLSGTLNIILSIVEHLLKI